MSLWIWLGIPLAAGLLVLAALIYRQRPATTPGTAAEETSSPAALVRAQLKLAILQDRLEQATHALAEERGRQEEAARRRLAATEAAYQRQMLAMGPRLAAAQGVDAPVQITINVAPGAAAVDAPERVTVEQTAVVEPQPAAEPAAPAPPSAEAAPPAQAEAAPEPLLLAPPVESLLLREETPDIAGESGDMDADEAPDAELLAESILVAPAQNVFAAPAPKAALMAAITLDADEAAAGSRAADLPGEEAVLEEEEVERFLAVANGEVEDPFDGLEPGGAGRPFPTAHDGPPAVPDAPLEDLDDLAEPTGPPAVTGSPLTPRFDELDADFADDDEAWSPAAAPQQVEPGHSAATSRWEVLPREEVEMANLDYLDSGVFAVPALPGWGGEPAVKQRPAPAAAAEQPPAAATQREDEAAQKPPQILPDPQDALSWLDELEETPPAVVEGDTAAFVEATVAQIMGQAPESAVTPPAAPQTEEDLDRQTVEAILARAAAALDEDAQTGIIERAQPEAEPAPPPFAWERRPIAWDAAYFDNTKLKGEPALVRKDREIDFDWGPQAPGTGVPAGEFSVRWHGTLILEPGLYRFTLQAPDGIRLWLNERLVLSAWYDQSPQEYAREFNWQGGSLYVRCEHYEHGPEAFIHFDWERIA